ncbi:inositol 1,4,5-trisphosphate receptor-interacting protein-like 1 [Patagioenas fasciata monilis]|uniref:Inositol 1,4,5-trisphosphate receptor-interacting protein-like 1 n=1 Tax=Patagioenas fasciata monilis TaxID=372326 RepID=A0A1V4KA12_PATFA|nr:inositol 1,4,5-trisphosphate receptor-interacting protein-like 1 [Patagioenas fasciata monilis]
MDSLKVRGKRSREPEREEESFGNNVEKEKHGEENDDANDPGRFFEDPTQRPVQNRDRDCEAVKNLVEKFIDLFNRDVSNTWYPVVQKAIEVGTIFEGWSPQEVDITHHLLVSLRPPRGHIFHLEPGPVWPMRNFRIHVELVCTCEMEQPAGETRCFLHDPEEEQSRKEGPNILDDLCTDSYLDVQKTAHWFQKMVRCFWKDLPESATHHLMVLPSDRSCKLQVLTQGWKKRFLIELMFGVQERDSDVFLSSQYTEAAYTPSTMWPETYAVAEMKFFSHIAIQAEPDTCHLRCLQLCVSSLLGRDISAYTLTTVVMHLLTIIPLSRWRKDIFMERLEDIMLYLQRCLNKKGLNHFFIGNDNVPEVIILPEEVQTAKPFNLFQHLEHDPDANEEAWLDFLVLQCWLRKLILHGH